MSNGWLGSGGWIRDRWAGDRWAIVSKSIVSMSNIKLEYKAIANAIVVIMWIQTLLKGIYIRCPLSQIVLRQNGSKVLICKPNVDIVEVDYP